MDEPIIDYDEYEQFIREKSQLDSRFGFEPTHLPDHLFPFQKALTTWQVEKGRGATFADCGLGKTLIELAVAQNFHEHTGLPSIIFTPLAVGAQFLQEAHRFDYDAARSERGEISAPIVIANYERIHLFDPAMFGDVICDESSILKSFEGIRRKQITEFLRLHKFRMLGTATAAPNDYTELGTSSEALGGLGYMDMIGRFFTNKQKTSHALGGRWRSSATEKFRFRGWAEPKFWRWVASWARALRKPSDLGYDDNGFILPELHVQQHVIRTGKSLPGMLLELPAIGWQEVRAERRNTIPERCQKVADLVNGTGEPAVVWCNLNPEGDLLEKLIPDAKQVAGKHSDAQKEERFEAFQAVS